METRGLSYPRSVGPARKIKCIRLDRADPSHSLDLSSPGHRASSWGAARRAEISFPFLNDEYQ